MVYFASTIFAGNNNVSPSSKRIRLPCKMVIINDWALQNMDFSVCHLWNELCALECRKMRKKIRKMLMFYFRVLFYLGVKILSFRSTYWILLYMSLKCAFYSSYSEISIFSCCPISSISGLWLLDWVFIVKDTNKYKEHNVGKNYIICECWSHNVLLSSFSGHSPEKLFLMGSFPASVYPSIRPSDRLSINI